MTLVAYKILKEGFENSVRGRLGVKVSELDDEAINDKFIAELAENVVVKRVPSYASILDDSEKMFLESAIINYICYLLAPAMSTKFKYKVSTADVKWEKSKVNWDARAKEFLGAFENDLSNIESVDVVTTDADIFKIVQMVRDED